MEVIAVRIPQGMRDSRYVVVASLSILMLFPGIAMIFLPLVEYESTAIFDKFYHGKEGTEYQETLFLPSDHWYHVDVRAGAQSYIHVRITVEDVTRGQVLRDEVKSDRYNSEDDDDAEIATLLKIPPTTVDLVIHVSLIVYSDTEGFQYLELTIYQDPPETLPSVLLGTLVVTLAVVSLVVNSRFDVFSRHSSLALKQMFTSNCPRCGIPVMPSIHQCPNCLKKI